MPLFSWLLTSLGEGIVYATKFLNVAIKAEYLKDTPIPKTSTTEEKELDSLAQKILTGKERDPKADTTALEREIDQLVYNLYELTAEEIAIVEEATRGK